MEIARAQLVQPFSCSYQVIFWTSLVTCWIPVSEPRSWFLNTTLSYKGNRTLWEKKKWLTQIWGKEIQSEYLVPENINAQRLIERHTKKTLTFQMDTKASRLIWNNFTLKRNKDSNGLVFWIKNLWITFFIGVRGQGLLYNRMPANTWRRNDKIKKSTFYAKTVK